MTSHYLDQWWRWVNSLWHSDTIWRQRSGSTLAQVMACCLTALSHHLNQCWLIISEVQWHSYLRYFTRDASIINHWHQFQNYMCKISFKSLRGQWVNYAGRRCIIKSHKASNPWDWTLKIIHYFEIWQVDLQQCCQISEHLQKAKSESCKFETSQDLVIRCLSAEWRKTEAVPGMNGLNLVMLNIFQEM